MPKISELWKEKTIEVLTNLYGNEIDKDKLEQMLDNELEKRRKFFPKMQLRNLYTTQNFSVEMDDILDIIKKEDLCVEANNTMTYSLNKVASPLPKILIKQKGDRNIHKKKMLKAKEMIAILKREGKFVEGCPEDEMFKDGNKLQLKVKVFMNSVYGVQGQKGSFLYSPDTAGAITAQGREMIAEMTWTIERLFYGTLHFCSMDEYISYIHKIKTEINPESEWLKYITYIPTEEDVAKQLAKGMHSIVDIDKYIDSFAPIMYNYIKNMTEIERIYYYYSCNLFNLIYKNKKIFDLFDTIIKMNISFLAPAYKPSDEDNERFAKYLDLDYTVVDSNKITDFGDDKDTLKKLTNYLVFNKINPIINVICKIIEEFVIVHMSTPKRALKYQTKRRRAIIVSDTDSIIVNLNPAITNLFKAHRIQNHLTLDTPELAFYDEDLNFKLVNIFTSILIHGTVVAGDVFCKNANVPENYRKWIEMKNEFLFKRLVMYTDAKKNYIVNTRLQEGKVLDEISATGIKLNSSVIHPEVKKRIMDCIETEMIKAPVVNPINIMYKVKDIENFIVESIKQGDLSLGKKARFSGMKGYKTGVYRNDAGRSALIWNILYPNEKINTGDYGYTFSTTLFTEDDIRRKMMSRFPEEANMLLEKIFKDENLKQYGLRSIMIPASSENIKKLPDWLIPYIDYAKMANKHMQPIISLLTSVGLKNSAISSSKTTYSPLISF